MTSSRALMASIMTLCLFILPAAALAQSGQELGIDYNQFNQQVIRPSSSIAAPDTTTAITNIIRLILGIAAFIAFMQIIIAGFQWRNHDGAEEEKYEAWGVLIRSGIGLIVIGIFATTAHTAVTAVTNAVQNYL